MIIDRDNIKIFLIILVVGIGLGYAYINSDLNINGTAQINHANWDVHWSNIQVTTGSVSASSPTISNQTTVNYSVTLNQPGDYYEFTVDAVNGGSIDAMIDTITSKLNNNPITNLPAYLNYTVTYADGMLLGPNHQLLHNTTEKYKVRIEYNTDIELNQIPASNQTLSLQFTVTYRQANENSTKVPHPYNIYRWATSTWSTNQDISSFTEGTDYVLHESQVTNMNAKASKFYLKYLISNNAVTNKYVAFVVSSEMAQANPGMTTGTYHLKGGDSGAAYEANKAVLLSIFGNSYCTDYGSYFYCSVSGLYTYAGDDGIVFANGGGGYCRVRIGGDSSCSDS